MNNSGLCVEGERVSLCGLSGFLGEADGVPEACGDNPIFSFVAVASRAEKCQSFDLCHSIYRKIDKTHPPSCALCIMSVTFE